MSILKEKSNFNIQAAELLLRNSLYAPSVHCSYYSCFQLLKYTINYFFDIDYAPQATETSLSRQKTHQYVVNYVTNELKQFVGFEESRKFKRSINDLKQFRVEADYENIEVNIDKGETAFKKAREIRTYLTTNFNI